MARYHSLLELYLTRLREFYRQPARIFWVYVFPTVMAVTLGLAFRSRPPEAMRATVVDNAAAAPVVAALSAGAARAGATGHPGVQIDLRPRAEAEHRLLTGKTPLVVVPGPGPAVTYRYDPTRPEALAARVAVDDWLQRGFGRRDPVRTSEALQEAPGSRYIDFLIPGLMGVNTMGGGMWGVGFLLVNFRIAKLLKRFQATPMPRSHFLMAVLGARLTFLVPDVVVLLALGVWGFHMPIRGSLALVGLIEVVGALAFAGLGLLIASRTSTTETVSGLMNLVMLPMWLLSGVFFASDRFPAPLQPLIRALPLTQIVDALRRVILDGAGFAAVSGSLAILAAWAVVTFALALRLFRWS